jgi:hypothetical protein
MTLQERRERIKAIEIELRTLRNDCPHEIAIPPDYWEKLKKDQWHTAAAECIGCGYRFGWFCPNSSDHICNFEEDDVCKDNCVNCGMPEERK